MFHINFFMITTPLVQNMFPSDWEKILVEKTLKRPLVFTEEKLIQSDGGKTSVK